MSVTFTEANKMPGRNKENFTRDRVEFKAPPEWIEEVTLFAKSLGLSLSAYMRFAVNEDMRRRKEETGSSGQKKK